MAKIVSNSFIYIILIVELRIAFQAADKIGLIYRGLPGYFVMNQTARLVMRLSLDHHQRGVIMSRPAVVQPLRSGGRRPAAWIFADRRTLVNLVGHAENLRHRAKRLSPEIQIEASYAYILAVQKQPLEDADYFPAEKMSFIYRNVDMNRLNHFEQLFRSVLIDILPFCIIQRIVSDIRGSGVYPGLDEKIAGSRDMLQGADPIDQSPGLEREHAAGENL